MVAQASLLPSRLRVLRLLRQVLADKVQHALKLLWLQPLITVLDDLHVFPMSEEGDGP